MSGKRGRILTRLCCRVVASYFARLVQTLYDRTGQRKDQLHWNNLPRDVGVYKFRISRADYLILFRFLSAYRRFAHSIQARD